MAERTGSLRAAFARSRHLESWFAKWQVARLEASEACMPTLLDTREPLFRLPRQSEDPT